MKDFTMELRNICGIKLDTYIITAKNRNDAYEAAEKQCKIDFPNYPNGVGIFCIKEERIIELPVAESQIITLKALLTNFAISCIASIEKYSDEEIKNYFKNRYEISQNLYLKILELEENLKGDEND